MKIHEITDYLEEIAPLHYQESYDNSGLLVGDFKGVYIDGAQVTVADVVASHIVKTIVIWPIMTNVCCNICIII